jgi:hypothetical protein
MCIIDRCIEQHHPLLLDQNNSVLFVVAEATTMMRTALGRNRHSILFNKGKERIHMNERRNRLNMHRILDKQQQSDNRFIHSFDRPDNK